MDIYTALSKIWGFFVVILMILISDRLHLHFVVKRLKRNLESLKTNYPTLLHDIKDSVFIAKGSNRSAKELSDYLGSNIKINELGVFCFDSEKNVTVFNANGKQKELSIVETLPKSHSKNRHVERVNTRIMRMGLDVFSFYQKGNSIEVYYKMKDMCDSMVSLIFIEIKVKSIFTFMK
ncbi:MAG: hypothetical protein EA412_00035 [Chitinophagaceae bacterium]|nr:MAG: hypothetical protein EA412_00035 [Chitinophagaceae bacterium]